jgi:uncharacterized protein YheU (UPF0270 family)
MHSRGISTPGWRGGPAPEMNHEPPESEPRASVPRESVVVPYGELAADLLRAVVESFVLREGTDYGERELSLGEKVERVIVQLKRGEVQIVFDPESESVSIVRR